MITHGKCVKIFTGNSNPELAKEIAKKLNVPLGICEVSKFSNGEISVDINETVRGADVFVIQSTCDPVNDNLMELLILLDAFKRASAGRITAVIPHYGYARQDRKAKARQPITAKLVADLIHTAGADRVLTMDLHAAQIQGFFNIPVDHLLGLPLLAEYFSSLKFNEDEVVAVSPDIGGVSRARQFAEMLHIPMAIIDKRRPRPNVSEVMNIIGNVEGKKAILVDDIIDTAGSICNAADALINVGAKEVYACCTHPVFSGPAIERLSASKIKKLIVLNTIPLREEAKIDKIKVISVATLFADAIRRIYNEESISVLFKRQMKK